MSHSGTNFVHLHVHTEYSLAEATCRLENLLQTAKAWNMNSLAITDKGTINGAIRFCEMAERYGIRPIVGCEMTVEGTGETLLLLAVTNRGYEQIVESLNRGSWVPPTAQGDLIALSGGRKGRIHRLIASGEMELAERQALLYADWFGKDHFYLEVYHHGFSGDGALLERTVRLSERTGIPIVATHDVHYLVPEDAPLLHVLGQDKNAPPPTAGPFYLPSPQQMRDKFRHLPEALENTVRIAERCRFRPERGQYRLPRFSMTEEELEGGLNSDERLLTLCRKGLITRYEDPKNRTILDRMNKELELIRDHGLSDYFLIVWDIVQAARSLGIPIGPGRGSAAGSLVAFLLGITEVDPLIHGLSFERFLSPDRPDLPDIDLDVCHRRRQELLQYVKDKYGSDRFAHIGVLNTYGTRGAVREAGMYLGMPKKQIDVIAKLMPAFSGQGAIRHCLENLPELQKPLFRQDPFRSMFQLAERIEGLPHTHSAHPSGILLGDERLSRTIPLQSRVNGEPMTPFTKEDIKALGLLKIDLLGLRNLTVIHDTLDAIRSRASQRLEVNRIPLDDADTFHAICSGNTLGCFQLESMGIRQLMRTMQPHNIGELADLLALYRPGAWGEGIVETYLRRRRREETYRIPWPALQRILAPTYGLILYQEQVMAIAHEAAGYSMGEADSLRRALSGKSVEALTHHQEKFVRGAAGKGILEKEALALFDLLARFAGYSFNKAHSVSYAHLSYWTVYLKTHFPKEYMASLLSEGEGYYDKSVYLREIAKMGLSLLGPDINRSGFGFRAEDNGIRVGMEGIHGSGLESVKALLSARSQGGDFHTFTDFVNRMKPYRITRPVFEAWIASGACDRLWGNRRQMLEALNEKPEESLDALLPSTLPDFTEQEKRKLEKSLLGFSLQPAQSTAKWQKFMQSFNVIPIESLSGCRDSTRVRVCGTIIHSRRLPAKGGGYVLSLVVQDQTDMIEAVMYPDTYKAFLYELNPRGILIEGIVRTQEGKMHVVTHKIKALGG